MKAAVDWCRPETSNVHTAPFTWQQSALMALAINLAGFAGGLCMSAVKRDRGIKDFGHMIEGHGGMLDRVDALLFAAPFGFAVILLAIHS